MRALVVAGLLTVAVLAGCSEPPNADISEALPSASGTSSSATGTANTTAPEPNRAPVANLTADVSNGTAPVLVNFTVGGSDPDGDALSWTLSVNGTAFANGTAVPAAANHTFNATGNWTVVLTVSDGALNATASLNVSALDGTRVPVLLAEYTNHGLIFGPYALTNDPMMAHQCPGFNAGQDGMGCVFLEFPAGAHDGAPAIVTTDAANFRMAFFPECGDPAATGVGFASGASGDAIVLPAGAGCGVTWSSNTGDWPEDRAFTLSVYDWLPEDDEDEE